MPQLQHISYQRVLLMVFLIVVPMLFPAYASAHQAQTTAGGPTILKVSVGFDGIYQDGNWIPIQIDLGNTGSDFKGKIAVGVPSIPTNGAASTTSTNTYQEDIDLPPGAQKQVTISVPFNQALQGSNSTGSINLIDNANHVIAHKALIPNTNSSNLTLIGVLSDTPNNFNQLNLAISSLLSTSGQLKSLTAATLPTQAEVLKNFDVLVIDNFTTSTLSKDQLAALQSWVNQGGTLIVTGGPEWKRTLSSLSSLSSTLLPVTIKGNGTLPAGTHLLPINDMTKPDQRSADTLKSAVSVSIAQPAVGSTILLTSGNIPLITQHKQGQGITYYLAYDPTIEPLASWSQTSQIWSSLLIRPLADSLLTAASTAKFNMSNPNAMSWQNASYNTSTMVNLLQSFFPNAYPSIWLVLLLLISYILILGPIRLLIIRVFKRRNWTWRIVLGTILVFTLLSYSLALYQKGSSIITSSITIEQLHAADNTGSTGQVTTFVGVFVPSQGDFQVHVPGTSLVQPTDQTNNMFAPSPPTSDQHSTFTLGNNSTDIDLQGVDIWTTRTLIAQHDTHTSGAITSQLQLQQNTVSGTVTNGLPYGLSDAFVLIGESYVSIGDLPPNSSKQVNIDLANKKSTGPNNSTLIADQIATSRGMQVSSNGPFLNNNKGSNNSQDTARHHALMLEAMSGASCDSNNNCFNQGMQIISNGGVLVKQYLGGNGQSAQDPLLLPGSAATIIGWAKSPLIQNGDITVNGQNTNDAQETLVQAPLDLNFTGNVNIASGLISSQIVHIQQNSSGNIQEALPDTYLLQTGSMTFEYSLPTTVQIQKSALTFSSSTNANQIPGQNVGATSDINSMQCNLYNWQTGNWDTITFTKFVSSVNTAQPYIGPGNRVLLHVSNHDSSALFGKPALAVQGTVIH